MAYDKNIDSMLVMFHCLLLLCIAHCKSWSSPNFPGTVTEPLSSKNTAPPKSAKALDASAVAPFKSLRKVGSVVRLVRGRSMAGCWLSPTPLKNDGVKVSWDDDIPN